MSGLGLRHKDLAAALLRHNAAMPGARGFILQATYRVTSDERGRRVPVVHLHGRLERGIKGGCEIDGEPVTAAATPHRDASLSPARVYNNPTLRPAEVSIEPRVLSFDIETDSKGERLLAISLFAAGIDEVLIVDAAVRAMPERAVRCASETAALDLFGERVRASIPT